MSNSDPELPASTRIVLRPIASPLPIGFLALAVGSFSFAGLQLGWIPVTEGQAVATCLLAFVVPLQAVSFVLNLLARDEGAGTGMGVLTGSWFAIGLVLLHAKPGETSGGLGLLLVGAAAALIVPIAAAVSSKPLGAAVITVTVLRFATAGTYELGAGDGWKTATGIVGLILAGLAWYAAGALALEDSQQRAVLPTFRGTRSAAPPIAVGSSNTSLLREAGVRAKL